VDKNVENPITVNLPELTENSDVTITVFRLWKRKLK